MATSTGISLTLKRPDPPKSKKVARDAEDMRQLNKIFETRFRKAGLPEEPYVMNIDDRYGTLSDCFRHGSRDHFNVRNTPFAPEEAYLQYQSFLFRDFYATDDCILRLHNPQDESFLRRMGVRPTTAQSASETEASKQPPKERKKISFKDYQARSKAGGTAVSTPVVPHAGSVDLRKEALKHAFAGRDEPVAESAPKLSTVEVKSVPIPQIKVDVVDDDLPALVSSKDEKTLGTSISATSHPAAGTKRKHEDFSNDAHMKSEVDTSPPSKKPKSDASPAPHAPLPTSSISNAKPEAVTDGIIVAKDSSPVAKTPLKIEQTVDPVVSDPEPAAVLLPHFANPSGKKRKRESDISPPRFTLDGRDATPSSPDTVGPRNVSSTASSQSSAKSNRSVLWSSDSDRAQVAPAKPKPIQAGVARPVQATASASPKPKPSATPLPLKPKFGTGIAKKVIKDKKNVSTPAAGFFESLSSTPVLAAARPSAAGSAPQKKSTGAVPAPVAMKAVKDEDKLVIKLKYSKELAPRVQKIFEPPATPSTRPKPAEEDIARLQRLASHLRREVGKQRTFGADGLAEVLGKAAADIEAHLKH